MKNLGVEFSLNTGVNFLWYIHAGMMLQIDNVLIAFFDNGFVRDREEFAAIYDNFEDVICALLSGVGGQCRLDHSF